ncbi:MAG: hypothetical protein OXP09_12110 [Gammaproteobacteria bacterium]|nr:hypothetical protein [Gammaproteobacteria bacterium]MDE0366306.1 hypothetical protein [Gammaproteobacteria bacterium]
MSDIPENSTENQAAPRKMSLTRSIIFAAVTGFGVVSFWRGVWYLWDVFTLQEEHRLFSALASMITGIVILAVMRTFYSVLAPPIHRLNIR